MVRGTVNGGGGLVLGSTGPLDAGRAHSEGGNGGLDSGEHWGRSREWTKKKPTKANGFSSILCYKRQG